MNPMNTDQLCADARVWAKRIREHIASGRLPSYLPADAAGLVTVLDGLGACSGLTPDERRNELARLAQLTLDGPRPEAELTKVQRALADTEFQAGELRGRLRELEHRALVAETKYDVARGALSQCINRLNT